VGCRFDFAQRVHCRFLSASLRAPNWLLILGQKGTNKGNDPIIVVYSFNTAGNFTNLTIAFRQEWGRLCGWRTGVSYIFMRKNTQRSETFEGWTRCDMNTATPDTKVEIQIYKK
jgi:hypothetical protein